MTVFEDFRKKHSTSHCVSVSEESFRKYQGKLPEAVIELWREDGWCAYSKGLIFFVNPDDFDAILQEWLDDPAEACVFARTGFGDLLIWNGNAVYKLYVHLGTYGRLMRSVESYVETRMVDKADLEESLDLSLFNQATKKFGVLASDECFTFVPALALGGEPTIEKVEKVKMQEQLLILAQLHGKLKTS
jgi:hypothetical protein